MEIFIMVNGLMEIGMEEGNNSLKMDPIMKDIGVRIYQTSMDC